jgi:hypothetical protein
MACRAVTLLTSKASELPHYEVVRKGGGMVAFLSGLVLGAFILAVAMVVTIAAKTKGEDA